MVTVSAVAVNLYLGGWHGPFIPPEYKSYVPSDTKKGMRLPTPRDVDYSTDTDPSVTELLGGAA